MLQWVVRNADTGVIRTENVEFVVEDTIKIVRRQRSDMSVK